MSTDRIRRVAGAIVVASLLAACQDSQVARATDGTAIGIAADWKPVPANEAHFSILGDWSLVTGPWSNRFIQTRNQTSVRISGGSILYESNVGTRVDATPSQNLKVLYETDLKIAEALGVSMEAGNPRTLSVPFGRIDYAVWRGNGRICIGARIFSDGLRDAYAGGDFYNAYARGSRCLGSADQAAPTFEESTLDLFKRVALDKGTANRTRTSATYLTPPQTSRANSAVPTLGNRPAASIGGPLGVGGRLVVGRGYLQITSRSETLVEFINPAGQGGRWYRGFFVAARNSGGYFVDKIGDLFPLTVGKSVEFQESGLNGDRWVQTVKVVREETLTIDGARYPVFVIESRDKALAPHQGNYEYLRTAWYSTQIGAPLMYRQQNIGRGGTEELFWGVTSIEMP